MNEHDGFEMSRYIPHALNQVLAAGRFTAIEMGSAAQCSDSMIYQVRNEEKELCMTKVQRLAQWMCRNGDTTLARCFITPEYEIIRRPKVETNGQLEDEALALNEAFGHAIDAFKAGNTALFHLAADQLAQVAAQIAAEGERL